MVGVGIILLFSNKAAHVSNLPRPQAEAINSQHTSNISYLAGGRSSSFQVLLKYGRTSLGQERLSTSTPDYGTHPVTTYTSQL